MYNSEALNAFTMLYNYHISVVSNFFNLFWFFPALLRCNWYITVCKLKVLIPYIWELQNDYYNNASYHLHPSWKLCLLQIIIPISPPPPPRHNQESASCLYGFDNSGHFIQKDSYNTQPFVSDFLTQHIFKVHPCSSIGQRYFISFMAEFYSILCIYHKMK